MNSLQSPGVARPNTVSYDQNGQMKALAYANTETISHSYDKAGELTSISSPKLSFTYHFDQAGRRTNIDRSGAAVGYGDVFYKYDADGRVNTAGPNSSASQTEYYYDLVGNRHTLMVNSGDPKGITTYVYDPVNRLLEEFGPLQRRLAGVATTRATRTTATVR